MKYFTPDLFEQLNSPNANERLDAWTRWDEAERDYRDARSSWLASAPAGIRKLVKKYCGHDAEIVSQNRTGTSILSLVVVGDSTLWTLNYRILSEPISTPPRDPAKHWSPADHRLWLYDELSRISARHFRHEILLSDGSTVQINFSTVQVSAVKIGQPSASKVIDLNMTFTLSGRTYYAVLRQKPPGKSKPASPREKSLKVTRSSKQLPKPAVK
ncbi:MAG: hypothetical protein ACKVT0_00975 [Planctomycetaceae bacterium]